MLFLIDKSPADVERKNESSLVGGQLLTPLTNYRNWGGKYAIDNGAFSTFHADAFVRQLARNEASRADCFFVTVPDIVGSAQRTIELWRYRRRWVGEEWPLAFVAQDGQEMLPIPWNEMAAVFIGGGDPWKDSKAAQDIVKTATRLGIHVHVGRVNTPKRYDLFADLGADTCDGSGVARYDHMLENIEVRKSAPTLF